MTVKFVTNEYLTMLRASTLNIVSVIFATFSCSVRRFRFNLTT